MNNRIKEKWFLKTEILPAEIPNFFSNSPITNQLDYILDDKIMCKLNHEDELTKYTVPMTFYIPKNDGTKRSISVLHPRAQLNYLMYIKKYEFLLINFMQKSRFNMRKICKLNKFTYNDRKAIRKKRDKLEQEYGIVGSGLICDEELDSKYRSYFAYNIHNNLSKILSNPRFLRATHKYNYFLKLDIQNFFGSIYTHTLTWAIVGDRLHGKNYADRKLKSTFAAQTDNVEQKGNFNETNGIIVGPEINRIIADIILSQCDFELETLLSKSPYNLALRKDFEVFRFIDDYYIFCKTREAVEIIESELSRVLEIYNLKLNTSKKELQKSPFTIVYMPIIQLKNTMSSLKNERRLRCSDIKINDEVAIEKYRESVENNFCLNYKHVLVSKSTWINVHDEIQSIIGLDKNSKRRVVLYFLKSLKIDLYEIVFFKKDDNNYACYKKTNSYIQILYCAIECITNIFHLHIDSDTTMAYIKIMMKLRNEILNFHRIVKKCNSDIWIPNIERVLSNIEDKIFENIYRTIHLNISDLSNISDLIVFVKRFGRKISPQQLCDIIDNNKSNYFTLCSVAYYIQDLNSKTYVMKNFQVVLKKLYNTVFEFLENYQYCNQKRLDDATFFYMLNDFSHYPPFINNVIYNSSFEALKKSEMLKFGGPNSKGYQIYKLLIKESYYNWNLKEIDFERLVLNKIIINQSESMGY